MTHAIYSDRSDAGRKLASRLEMLRGERPMFVGIAPGGVPVAYAAAVALEAPLEAWAVEQLHLPGAPGRHVGAVAEDGAQAFLAERALGADLTHVELDRLASQARTALDARASLIRRHPRRSMRNHTVIVVDDGLATGATVCATIRAIRQEKPHRVVVALPIAVRASLGHVERFADGVVCLAECEDLQGIRAAYGDFGVIDDTFVADLLERRHHAIAAHPHASRP